MPTHEHAPCIKDPVTLHLLAERGLLTSSDNARLHSSEGCGNCPRNSTLGSCAVLQAIGGDQISLNQRSALITRLTSL